MRYDTEIFFQCAIPGTYNPSTGNYDRDNYTEELKMASVMDTQTETMKLVYGSIKQGSLSIHLQNHYDKPFDSIRIGSKRYKVDLSRKLRVKQSYVVSEVQ